ncbi:hypothetical protein CYMTET_41626 [Cymbomonas tetramitiformis]|uniref:Uncharacterized protein n=1 Tax=Cymbomonas tetramitiformis TaxID=36881 RepID=A0AAE0C5R6_9CHLO|nr:hypothetical protein CYMTET_41626 [Cymbomonas tetramitiformis]
MLISSVAPAYTLRKTRLDELVQRNNNANKGPAFSSFINEMWRNSENEEFWKCPEKSGQYFCLLDPTVDMEMGGSGVLPTAVRPKIFETSKKNFY